MRDVFGCYLTAGNQVEHSFAHSLAALTVYDNEVNKRLAGGTVFVKHAPSGGIFTGRNDLTRAFLDTSARWMWMIDSDMGFAPETLDRLLVTAANRQVTMVGALCFTWDIQGRDGMGGHICRPKPTIYGHDGQGFKSVRVYDKNSVIQAAGTGAACVIIHRSVMEKVRAEHGEHWWTPMMDETSGQFLGEDLSFFLRANLLGERLVVDTRVKTTHAKTIHLSEDHYDLWGAGAGLLTWDES